MKILVICQYYFPEPFRVTDICEELVNQGHSVTVLTGLPNYPEGRILKEYKRKEHRDEIRNGVRIIRCYEHGRGENAINMLWNYYSFAISGKIKIKKLDKDFDIVFVNQLSPVMMAQPGIKYAKKYKIPCILYCYDLWPASLAAGGINKDSIIFRFFKKISKKIYNNVDLICVTSRSFIDYFQSEHEISAAKIRYLPQYCEDLYENIGEKKHDSVNYVFAGNVGKMQSVETIVKAAALIKDRSDILIHIVGDGRDLEKCKLLAKKLNVSNIIFHGRKPMDEMPKFYSIADAMIVTLAKDELISRTLPGKVQSYMAAGKPIIAAIDGETNRVITEANCGLTCPAENYEELAKLFCSFNEEDFHLMGENARKYSISNFSKAHFFDTLNKLL